MWVGLVQRIRTKLTNIASSSRRSKINRLDPTTAADGRSAQSYNGRHRPDTGPCIQKNSWRLTAALNAPKFSHNLADTVSNNTSLSRAWVAILNFFIYIHFLRVLFRPTLPLSSCFRQLMLHKWCGIVTAMMVKWKGDRMWKLRNM